MNANGSDWRNHGGKGGRAETTAGGQLLPMLPLRGGGEGRGRVKRRVGEGRRRARNKDIISLLYLTETPPSPPKSQ